MAQLEIIYLSCFLRSSQLKAFGKRSELLVNILKGLGSFYYISPPGSAVYLEQEYDLFAESTNGLDWQRKDEEAGIDVSENGWDSEMIEYPFIFDHKGTRYMLYNGNSYGKTGFGLAVI